MSKNHLIWAKSIYKFSNENFGDTAQANTSPRSQSVPVIVLANVSPGMKLCCSSRLLVH